jgi:hypothetical protein
LGKKRQSFIIENTHWRSWVRDVWQKAPFLQWVEEPYWLDLGLGYEKDGYRRMREERYG